jgi:hypothetical protein
MTRAAITEDAKIFLEVGAERPKEMGYEARIPFSICWVITDGVHCWKYLWIKRLKSGVYVAHTLPGGFHESYHSDGRRHWRQQGGTTLPLPDGPPLDSITGVVPLHRCAGSVRPGDLLRIGSPEFKDDPVDKLIYIDSRRFGPYALAEVYLVEPFKHGEVPLHIGHPWHLYLVSHTIPWILITIGEPAHLPGTEAQS